MKKSHHVEPDWQALLEAFERYDPGSEQGTLPYLNVRSGRITYFGEGAGIDLAETLDFDRHVAISICAQALAERHARMRAFAASVSEPEIGARLKQVLAGAGGVGLFYDVLGQHPELLSRWRRVEEPRVYELIEEWLRTERLTPRSGPPWRR